MLPISSRVSPVLPCVPITRMVGPEIFHRLDNLVGRNSFPKIDFDRDSLSPERFGHPVECFDQLHLKRTGRHGLGSFERRVACRFDDMDPNDPRL
jgi:hypothetical protein